MPNIVLDVRRDGDSLLLKPVAKELNFDNSDPFRKAIEETLEKHTDLKRVLIDLSEVEFLFSAGIGVLTYLLRYSKERGMKPPGIVQAQPFVHETLQVVGMENSFTFFDSPEAAFNA